MGTLKSDTNVVSWKIDARLAELVDNMLWNDIRQAAQVNPVLQEMLDRVVILYRLSDKNPK
jgi:hypothetical protein